MTAAPVRLLSRALAALAVATGVSLVALVLALPPPDVCLLRSVDGTSTIEESRLPPVGIRCTYTGPGRRTVVDHRVPPPLVLAPPLLVLSTALVAVRRRSRRVSPA